MRYDSTFFVPPRNHQNQPCHGYVLMNTKSNDADPIHMLVSCCVVLGLAKLVIFRHVWPTECTTGRPGMYSIFHITWLIVESVLASNPQMLERPLPMHFLCRMEHYPLLYIVVSFVGVSDNIKSRPISPTKK